MNAKRLVDFTGKRQATDSNRNVKHSHHLVLLMMRLRHTGFVAAGAGLAYSVAYMRALAQASVSIPQMISAAGADPKL
jgi:hypothetical protein